jgi:formyl-CoA transferase
MPAEQSKKAQPKKPALALSGVRVLALELSVAGPHATRILGDMGAEVIKLEKLGTGDLIRQWDSAVHGLSSGFVWLNGNKRSFAVDVKKKVSGSSALPTNGRRSGKLCSGVADRMGLERGGTLCARNPRLILFRLRLRRDGPYRDVKATCDQGEAESSPPRLRISLPSRRAIIDLLPLCMPCGILLALYQRKTGVGG